jgi:hypothetical protein
MEAILKRFYGHIKTHFIAILKTERNMSKTAIPTAESLLPVEVDDPLKPLIDDFLRDLDAAPRSPHTIKNHRSDLISKGVFSITLA